MKKIKWLILLCALCFVGVMAGCNPTSSADDKITIVCTNFPLYDWTSQLLKGCDAKVILLLNNGADMHSFQPSAEELIQIADCDMLVHVGGESDTWLVEALEANPNDNRVVVNLMEVLKEDVRAEHYVNGMQTEHVHADGSVCEEEHHHEVPVEEHTTEAHSDYVSLDEHVWLSPRLAIKSCEVIEENLCQVLPDAAEAIRANGKAYCEELMSLDQKYTDMVMGSDSQNVVIVADRFPFMYMMEDYGIEYYAAFPGCSTESEADFETVVFMAEKVIEHNTEVLLITEGGTDTLANTVFENAGISGETAVLHSMQVVYQSDVEAGASYLNYMEANLEVLKRVLSMEE